MEILRQNYLVKAAEVGRSWWVMSSTVTDFEQPRYNDSPLYGYQMSLTSQLTLVANFSSKLVSIAV